MKRTGVGSARIRRPSRNPAAEGLLDHADALAANGCVREAISELVEANRTHRDARIERRLIGLRHDAFGTIEAPRAAALQPVSGRGPPDDLTAIERVADEVATVISSDGFSHRHALVPPHRLAGLIEDIDHAFASCDSYTAGQVGTEWYDPYEPGPADVHIVRPWLRRGGGLFAADSPRTFFDLFEIYEEEGVLEIVANVLGERPVVSLDKCTLRRIDAGDGITWHQDGAFMGADLRAVNVWMSLSESGRRAPGLELVPKRLDHVVAFGTEGAEYPWSVAPSVVEATIADVGIHHPVLAPGDALIFDGFLLHRTCPGHGARHRSTRYAIETWFFAPSAYPAQQKIPLVV